MRPDLLSLTPDDLAALINRGTVKGAQRDLEGGKRPVRISEAEDGTVTVEWPDDGNTAITCTLHPGAPWNSAMCTCPATVICRHIIGAVLVYQTWAAEQHETAPPVAEPWNPGEISDEMLAEQYRKAELNRWRKEFESGQVFELVCGVKPLARIHTQSCTVRFLVPHDLRYTKCDCSEDPPCKHVPLAVWAFRQLQDEAGLIETGVDTYTTPYDVLHDLDAALADLMEIGFAGGLALRRLKQVARGCREADLIWHAELIDEIAQEYERYTAQDARFSGIQTAALLGELLIRMRAVRNPTPAIPGIFVRGSRSDRETEIDSSVLIGLGCGVEFPGGAAPRLTAYFQDAKGGQVVAIRRDFRPEESAAESSFAHVARASVLKELTYGVLGKHQVFIKRGVRTPEMVMSPGRAPASAAPQQFTWENLHAPLLSENFAEIRARHAAMPPTALRPRRVGEDLIVCAVEGVENVAFDLLSQSVVANLIDATGEAMPLMHPYTTRGAEGVDALLWHLQHRALKFVCGRVRSGGVFAPLSLIFEHEGYENTRYMVQPWIERRTDEMDAVAPQIAHEPAVNRDPLVYYPMRIMTLLGELLVNGLRRVDSRTADSWRQLAAEGHGLGFVRLVEPVAALADSLTAKQHVREWDWHTAAVQAFDVAVTTRFAQEEF